MAQDLVRRIVPKSVIVSSATLTQVAAALDTAMTNAMNTVLTTPPAGYQPGSITIDGQPVLIYDGTVYAAIQQFFYITSNAA